MKKIMAVFFLLVSSNLLCVPKIFLQITKNFSEKAEIVLIFEVQKDNYWNKFIKVLSRDLEFSGYFDVEETEIVKDIEKEKKKYTTEIVLTGKKEGNILKIKVEDNLEETVLFEKNYGIISNASSLAHKINNEIILKLTGKPGIAGSKILFVSGILRKYQIYSIEYDGENLKKLTDFNFLVHYPRWLPQKGKIVFITYENGYPEIAKLDLKTGKRKIILNQPGLNACVSPCKSTGEMAVVLSKSGNPEIYLATFEGVIIKRLTYYKGIDSSPSFSPDGKLIAFVSDRQGNPQIYLMTRDGYRIRRISYISGYSTSPSFSPDGNFVAYVFASGGNFGLALYNLKTKKTKIVGKYLGCEEISWGSDSRHIVYSKTDKTPNTLYIIDILTGERRRLTPGKINAFSPDWFSY